MNTLPIASLAIRPTKTSNGQSGLLTATSPSHHTQDALVLLSMSAGMTAGNFTTHPVMAILSLYLSGDCQPTGC